MRIKTQDGEEKVDFSMGLGCGRLLLYIFIGLAVVLNLGKVIELLGGCK